MGWRIISVILLMVWRIIRCYLVDGVEDNKVLSC